MKSGRFILDRISAFHGVPASFEMTGQFNWTNDQRNLDRMMNQFPMPSLNSNGMSTRNRKNENIGYAHSDGQKLFASDYSGYENRYRRLSQTT